MLTREMRRDLPSQVYHIVLPGAPRPNRDADPVSSELLSRVPTLAGCTSSATPQRMGSVKVISSENPHEHEVRFQYRSLSHHALDVTERINSRSTAIWLTFPESVSFEAQLPPERQAGWSTLRTPNT